MWDFLLVVETDFNVIEQSQKLFFFSRAEPQLSVIN